MGHRCPGASHAATSVRSATNGATYDETDSPSATADALSPRQFDG